MKGQRLAAAGLALCLLTGCAPLLERSYTVSEPHSSKLWESEAAGTLRAENHQDIVNDLLILIGQQILPAGGQSYCYLAGNFVPQLAALVDDLALQNGQQIEYRHILHTGIADSQHIVVGHVTGGEHTVQRSVLIAHGPLS